MFLDKYTIVENSQNTTPQCCVVSLKLSSCKIEIGNALYDQFPSFIHTGCKPHGKQHNYIVNGNIENVRKKILLSILVANPMENNTITL